jgi:hypothetical protein
MPGPTPTQRLNELEPRLEAVEQALGTRPPQPKVHWAKRFWNTVLAHPGTSTLTTIIVVVGGLACTQLKSCFTDAVQHQMDARLKEPGGVLEKLDKLQTTTDKTNTTLETLQPFIQDLVRRQFDTAAKLSPQELGPRLPAVKNLIVAASSQRVAVAPGAADDLTKNLIRVNQDLPNYWPVAAELVSYRSHLNGGWQGNRLPDCTVHDLKMHVIDRKPSDDDPDADIVTHGPINLQHCAIVLDSPDGEAVLSHGVSFGELILTDCQVFYGGGPITLTAVRSSDRYPAKLWGPISFVNCIFTFQFPNQPPLPGRNLTNTLLASNAGAKIVFNPAG